MLLISLVGKMKHKTNSGFTIIEMLVALVIFSALLSVTLVGFQQGINSWKRSLKGLSEQQYLLKREQWFYPLFEQAIAAEYIYPEGVLGVYFEGNTEQMQFVSGSPILTGPGRNAGIEMRVHKEGNTEQLQYRQKFNADIQRGFNWDREKWYTLVKDMKQIQFEYLAGVHLPSWGMISGLAPEQQQYYRDSPAWISTFKGKEEESLPHQVAIIFTTEKNKHIRWEFSVTYNSDALAPMFGN